MKGLLLNMWRYSQELLGAHMLEYGTLHGGGFISAKEELLRSTEVPTGCCFICAGCWCSPVSCLVPRAPVCRPSCRSSSRRGRGTGTAATLRATARGRRGAWSAVVAVTTAVGWVLYWRVYD